MSFLTRRSPKIFTPPLGPRMGPKKDFGTVVVTRNGFEIRQVLAFRNEQEKISAVKSACKFVIQYSNHEDCTHQVSLHYGLNVRDLAGVGYEGIL